jgi:hypothetical protein
MLAVQHLSLVSYVQKIVHYVRLRNASLERACTTGRERCSISSLVLFLVTTL